MVTVVKHEIWGYDEGDMFRYRITGSYQPRYGHISDSSHPIQVSIERHDFLSWQNCAKSADFSIIEGSDVDDTVLSELTYLTFCGVGTGYVVREIDVDDTSVSIYLESNALSELHDCETFRREEYFGKEYIPQYEPSLPVAFTAHLYLTNEAEVFPTFHVKAPRSNKSKHGKKKWRKFTIGGRTKIHIDEYGKKFHRRINFLTPSEEQKKNNEQPVEIHESRL